MLAFRDVIRCLVDATLSRRRIWEKEEAGMATDAAINILPAALERRVSCSFIHSINEPD
jgi:hypothetical protein